jgi:hypothetical protein
MGKREKQQIQSLHSLLDESRGNSKGPILAFKEGATYMDSIMPKEPTFHM